MFVSLVLLVATAKNEEKNATEDVAPVVAP